MAKCKICGSRIADGATKCPTCGSPVGVTAESLQPKPHVGCSSTSTAAGLGANVTSRTGASTGTGTTAKAGTTTGTGSTAKASTTSGTGSTSGIGTTTGIGHTAWTGATTGSGTTATPTPAPVILSPEEKKKKTERMVNSICAVIGVLFLVTCWIVGTILNRGSESASTTSRSSTSSSTSASSYSSQPLSVMGFTGQSTLTEVKNQLNLSGVSYSEFSLNRRLQGRVATYRIGVLDTMKYNGAIWSDLEFFFSPDNKLVAVQLDGYAEQDTLNAFNKMTQAYPVRTQKEKWHGIGPDEILIKNGRNENEYVERTIETWNDNANLHIVFYF